MYAGSANNGASRPESAAWVDMLRRFIVPVLALRKRRRLTLDPSAAVAERELAVRSARKARSRAKADVGSAGGSDGISHPYVEARRQWSERYGGYIQQAHHWRLLAVSGALVSLIAVTGIGVISTRSKVVPYLVDMVKFGEPAAVAHAQRTNTVDARLLRAYLARFVTDWRSVTVDRQAQKAAIDRVYAMLPRGSIALGKLNNFFKANSPFALAASESVNVSITSLLPISDDTWQVEWLEFRRDPRGAIRSKVRLKASIVVGITPPLQENMELVNPLGVYITDLNRFQQIQ